MWRSWARDFGWIFLVNLPGLFLLAHFPQGPDGAEMLSTALAGGVMHPSGMPLQAWLDRAAVALAPGSAGWILSLLSWSGHVLACLFLVRGLRLLGVYGFCLGVAVVAYSSHAVVAGLALQPEKYAWSAAMDFATLWAFASAIEGRRVRDFYLCSLTFALAVAQHSANLVYLFLPLVAAIYFFSQWPRLAWIKRMAVAKFIFLVVVVGFYISLLALRASRPWPDWGSLQSLGDVWHHFARSDFANGLFNPGLEPVRGAVKPVLLMLSDLAPWTLLLLCLPLGAFVLFRRSPAYFYAWMMVLVAGLGVLVVAKIPTDQLDLGRAYGERYQMLIMPLLASLLGVGVDQVWTWGARWRRYVGMVIAVCLAVSVATSAARVRAIDNNLIDIYRHEVGRELPEHPYFISANEIDLFYGVPCGQELCFPLKNLFGSSWYRVRTAPALEPRIKYVLAQNPLNYAEFIVRSVILGYPVATTTGSLMVNDPGLQGHLEQLGIVWLATREPRQVYSDAILSNARTLCGALQDVWRDVPAEGAYFNAEILHSFHYVYLGAGDALAARGQTDLGASAYAVAEALRPGVSRQTWAEKCNEFTALVK